MILSSTMLVISSLLLATFVALSSADLRERRQIVFPGEEEEIEPESSPCVTPDRQQGQCVPVTRCTFLLRVNNYNRLRRYFCGFEGEEPKVCCPGNNNRGGVTTTRATTTRTTTRRTRPTTTRPRVVTTRSTVTPRPQVTPGTSGRGRPSFLPRECGLSITPKTRIVGGREADKGSWPWMAVVYQEKRGVKSPDCGGALVATNYVITAAHCVVGSRAAPLDPKVLSVRLGEHNLYDDNDDMNPIEIPVESLTRHEEFDPRTYRNDIAILKLARHVTFRDDIRPICLPYDSLTNDDLTSRRAYVSGWGTTAFNGPSSRVLMEVSFPVTDQEVCRRAYERELPITEVYICAGTLDGSKDSCQGDSGGPLMLTGKENRFYLIGIVSFGKLCAQPGYPGVYTRVTNYLDWMNRNMS